ncbi:hypothetical protein CW751_11255 [Brumimicrobium salinarum]|uniref:Outer membrane protein beta-barrel domain-containing protein n=1 Tax=Brumimicrobium salinarum TaxID=2058658 RepID=A0A2I0R1F1_9FLAO|nr:outer membrane beta-barrel protein [Brumimicrobium salinarum]PKR80230.1 hypothetical protein CW751_11255 [Brumimicrobium salinarum]
MIQKGSFLFFIGCVISVTTTFSQQFSLEMFGGATSSQISGDGHYGFAQFGLNTGLNLNYQINTDWSANFGLQFNQKGARTYPSKQTSVVYRLRVNYIEVPVHIQYQFDRLSVGGGLYLGVKINQKERTSFGAVEPEHAFKSLTMGGLVDLKYAFHEKWGLTLRFQNDLIPVRSHKGNQVIAPALFIFGNWHQQLLNKGQYHTSLSLLMHYQF